jgi:hypothetical protein
LPPTPLDQVKTPKLELYEDNMEEELKVYNILEEELVTAKRQDCGHGKFRSSDGHTYRVEHDAAKKCVNILFNEEEEEPITHETERGDNKAAKRTRQRSVVKEELDDFYMPQGMKHSTFQSTDANIFKVERDCASKQGDTIIGEEEPATKKAAKRTRQRSAKKATPAKPAPKAAAKKESSSDDCDSNEDEKPTAKAAPAKTAPKAAAMKEESLSDDDSSD